MKRVALMVLAAAAVALLFGAVATEAQEFEYIGSKKCKKCHLKQYKSWEKSEMAVTFESLKPDVDAEAKTTAGLDPAADYTAEANCLTCHVTGYGKPGGFVDIETTPTLAGVGCESCHGAGGGYTQDGYMTLDNKEYAKAEIVAQGMVDQVGADQCTSCHNANEGNPFPEPDFQFSADEGTHDHHALKYEH